MAVLSHLEVIARNLETTLARIRTLTQQWESIGEGITALEDCIRQDERVLADARARGEWHPEASDPL